jgi:hypothetical protein
LRRVPCGCATQANNLLRDLELLIFVAQSFKLQPKRVTGRRGKRTSDYSTNTRHDAIANGSAQHR